MQTIIRTATQARSEFFDLIAAANYSGQITYITKSGKVTAKIVPSDRLKFDRKKFLRTLNKAVGVFDAEDERQIKQVRIDSYKNRYPEW